MIAIYFWLGMIYFITMMSLTFSKMESRDAFLNRFDYFQARFGVVLTVLFIALWLICSFLFWPIEGAILLYKKLA